MASLFVIQGRDQGKRFELTEGVYGVGRDNTNPIQLHDTEVSRRHAEVRHDGTAYTLTDLNSSNGSFVNNEKTKHSVLRSGDRVLIGRTLMIFTGPGEQSSANLNQMIDIVSRDRGDGSRIIKAISKEEGSQIFGGPEVAQSPWLARARSNLQIMYRTALAVSHTLDIDQLLTRMLELIFEWVEADRGCIMLFDPETKELAPRAHRHRKTMGGQQERISISRTILDYVTQHQEGVLTSDASDDQRWDPAGSIVKMGVREAICVPMQGRYETVGVIYIDTYTPPGRLVNNPARGGQRFHDEHLKLMVAIAHQAALAVEDTNYYSAMVQAERLAAVGQAIAMLSHHIKNILQGIRGGSYLIEEGIRAKDFNIIDKGWTIVDKNQLRISNLVMDMLTFSKEREPEMVPAELNEVVGDVTELMQQRATDAGVKLEFKPDGEMPKLTLDPEALHRAILNIVTNAIDACDETEQGQVTLFTHYLAGEKMVQIIVQDNGQGIPPENVRKIFTIFESGKGNRGTGLGLPVSLKIAQEHGGDITVESKQGEGSKFIIQIPAHLAGTHGDTMAVPQM